MVLKSMFNPRVPQNNKNEHRIHLYRYDIEFLLQHLLSNALMMDMIQNFFGSNVWVSATMRWFLETELYRYEINELNAVTPKPTSEPLSTDKVATNLAQGNKFERYRSTTKWTRMKTERNRREVAGRGGPSV